MHHAGAHVLLPAGDTVVEEPVDERPPGMPATGVGDDPGRLVDHEEVLVLEHDTEVHRLGLQFEWRRRDRDDADRLPACQEMSLSDDASVDAHAAVVDGALGLRATADRAEPADHRVEAPADVGVGDPELNRFGVVHPHVWS